MYLEHFKLTALPFSITPDTDFFFQSASHIEALNVLLLALRSGDGFIKLTGEVGTGKTLLCRKLLSSLDDNFVTAYIPNPFINATALRMAVAEELGIEFARNIGQHRVLKLITDKLVEIKRAGKQVVLIVDEAQAMPDESLEALRLLSNLETEKEKLLSIVLFGQPELDVKLNQPKIRQLKQRILFSYQLRPLNAREVAHYVQHRLTIAGVTAPLFSKAALRRLHKASRGIPRLINILGHKSLMAAFGQGMTAIKPRHVQLATRDTEDARQNVPWRRWFMRFGTIAMLTGASVYVVASTL